jgi:DNA-binding MarR family transcriptional regulator
MRDPAPPSKNREISLLFDVFVLNQQLRTLLTRALAGTGLRPDEYAVYSALFELGPLTPTRLAAQLGMPLTTLLDYVQVLLKRHHAIRTPNPRDARSYLVRLTPRGLAAHRTAGRAWNQTVVPLEAALGVPIGQVRHALHALSDATAEALERLDGHAARAATA